MAEHTGAKWPAAQATVNFIGGGGGHDPPGYGPGYLRFPKVSDFSAKVQNMKVSALS